MRGGRCRRGARARGFQVVPGSFQAGGHGALFGENETPAAIRSGQSLAAIKARWAAGLAAYEARRQKYLIYPPRGP
jgi:hypothetical protein